MPKKKESRGCEMSKKGINSRRKEEMKEGMKVYDFVDSYLTRMGIKFYESHRSLQEKG
jgi:hypothetical protein